MEAEALGQPLSPVLFDFLRRIKIRVKKRRTLLYFAGVERTVPGPGFRTVFFLCAAGPAAHEVRKV